MMNQPTRKLAVDVCELAFAMQQHDPYGEIAHFLDLESGQVVMTTGEARRLLEEVYEEYGDPETGELDLPAILPQLDIHDWQKETLLEADQSAGYWTKI